MSSCPAISYILDDEGKLVDIILMSRTASDPSPSKVELELVRVFKEYKELKETVGVV